MRKSEIRNPKSEIKKIGLVINPYRQGALVVASELIDWLGERGIKALIEQGASLDLEKEAFSVSDDLGAEADLLIALGGDGTLLHTAQLAWPDSVPILAVNLGSLGFLTEITQEELFPALESILNHCFELESRMMLEAAVEREGTETATFKALNEVVVTCGALARSINITLLIDNESVANFEADGMILSTPTGSTAYSLSAGGPILNPTLDALIATPICPHALALRPVIIGPEENISLIVSAGPRGEIILTQDGQRSYPLKSGDRITAGKAKKSIYLVKPEARSFYQVLKTKLRWGGHLSSLPVTAQVQGSRFKVHG
ncbi:MAG: NAD(+)/NADH kinase [bacterium]|nr:NAD(+)/NADH kinase [bacterium]